MKILVFFTLLLMKFSCSFASANGLSECDSINKDEAISLNDIASKLGITYDFTNKKVAFYTGSGGGARTNKQRFFSECDKIRKFYPKAMAPMTQIYIFDEKERSKADGYDAVIVYGSVKQFLSKKKLIRRLHKFRF